MDNQEDDQMLYASFNQDASCFALGTERGFKIYNAYPFKDSFERVLDGGIGIVEMLYRSNILALVGGGKNPKYTPNKVIIWDDYQTKIVSELKFSSSVKNVKLKKDKIIVVCEQKIYVFNSQTYQNLDTLETSENPRGIIAINGSSENTIIGFPDKQRGFVKIKNYEKTTESVINAHENLISYISMNNDGTLLATASDKGTIIRLFNVSNGTILQEFRRGKEKAEINYIAFDNSSKFMAATSDRGTIHIWSLADCNKQMKDSSMHMIPDESNRKKNEDENGDDVPKNNSSIFKNLPGFLTGGFFKSDWSFAQVRLSDQKSICAFVTDNTLVTISSQGKYYEAKMDLRKGGECNILFETSLNKK